MDNIRSEESCSSSTNTDTMKLKKDSMTLDFSAGSRKARARELQDTLLSSPDVGLLKLTTPDLERFIVHSNGTLVSTPTQILFPKSVTEEQEAYARGFVDALVELHMKQSPLTTSRGLVCIDSQGSPYVTLTPAISHFPVCLSPANSMKHTPLLTSPVFSCPTTLDLCSPLRLLSSIAPFARPSPLLTSPIHAETPSRDESSMSDSASSRSDLLDGAHYKSGISPLVSPSGNKIITSKSLQLVSSEPVSPIDMTNQDKVKLERKREKNRTAAQRCRYKKLERISRLQARVNELKNQNCKLGETASAQKELVNDLRQRIVDHVNNGCQIMVSRDT